MEVLPVRGYLKYIMPPTEVHLSCYLQWYLDEDVQEFDLHPLSIIRVMSGKKYTKTLQNLLLVAIFHVVLTIHVLC